MFRYLFVFLFMVMPMVASVGTIELKSGARIRGDLLADHPDRVIIDLGFTVLSVPREEVDRVLAGDPETVGTNGNDRTAHPTDIFRQAAANLPTLSVNENVARVGGAVVLVRTPVGLGSGFIISPAGYVVTNQHVVAGEHTITVTVFKRTDREMERMEYKRVRIVALSDLDDLALLKIEEAEGTTFPSVALGNSDSLQEGQGVFAIGSPLGLDRTVSQGIVSARNRLLGSQLYIQTTTQINPGNSGGPLFNLRGEVVGVNNMKAMQVGIEGLNFAIPVTVLKNFLRNRDAYAFDPRNPNAGFRYLTPPSPVKRQP